MSEDDLVEALKALAHPVRLRILRALAGAERNVGDIDERAGIGQPTLSQQLAVLRSAGLVMTRKDAKLVFYRIAPEKLEAVGALAGQLAGPMEGSATGPAQEPRGPAPGVANFARLT